jgi:predicted CopG family antitoxin
MSRPERSRPKYEYKTIAVTYNVYKELVMIKTDLRKRSMNAVIRELIKNYKKVKRREKIIEEQQRLEKLRDEKLAEIIGEMLKTLPDILERRFKSTQTTGGDY